jgi:Ca2+-dependent lipid-binding protein
VRINLHQGKDLDTRRTGSECNAYARIYLRGQAIAKTLVFKRNHSPMWEAHAEFLATSRHEAVIGVKVIDSKGFAVDPTIGYVNVKLDDILEANSKGQDWFPLSGCASGKIRMTASFKPVAMAGAINSAGDFRPPIGIVRVWIKRAVDLKNVEALTGGRTLLLFFREHPERFANLSWLNAWQAANLILMSK